MPSDQLPFPARRLRAISLSGVGLVPLFRGSGLIRGRLMPAGGVAPSRGPLPGVIRVAGCRVGASPGGAGTALRLTRQGLLQPWCEQDLGVARQCRVEARGGGVVGVGEPDEGGGLFDGGDGEDYYEDDDEEDEEEGYSHSDNRH